MYRMVYERKVSSVGTQLFDPRDPRNARAETLQDARRAIRAVCGPTWRADLQAERDNRVVERRRNRQFVAIILEDPR